MPDDTRPPEPVGSLHTGMPAPADETDGQRNKMPRAPGQIRNAPGPAEPSATRTEVAGIIGFLVIAIGGLTWAKWYPYVLKGQSIARKHTMGASIITGGKTHAPAGWHAALSYSASYAKSIWMALVVGLLIATAIAELVPRDWLSRMLAVRRTRSVVLAGAAAVPSMMCTCCSAPAAVSMARSRATLGATLAYWLGNPVLNPATIVFMGIVLGWRWAALRIAIGLALVFGVALIAERTFGADQVPAAQTLAADTPAQPEGPLALRFARTLGRLCLGLLPEYAVIVLVLGAVRAFLFPAVTPSVAHAFWLVLLLAVTGTLMVIPTAGEIPIVSSFMALGLGAAGSAALLITLPAVSLPSLVMVGRALPRRVLLFVTSAVIAAGLVTAAIASLAGF
jgi:uncharacterized protein